MSHFYKTFLAVVSFCLWGVLSSQSHAFDCSKAYGKTEKTICNTPSLVALDNRMARYYVKALRGITAPNRTTLRKSQYKWLKSRNSCRDNVTCLKGHYKDWIAQYHKFAAKLATNKGTSTKKRTTSKKSRRTKKKTAQSKTGKTGTVQKISSPVKVEKVASPEILQDNL